VQDNAETTGKLDGSEADLTRFLQELVGLADQSDNAHQGPLLHLQFGDVLTLTSLAGSGGICYLTIAALLPHSDRLDYLPQPSAQAIGMSNIYTENEFLWDADEGRYVIIHKIPIAELLDERDVFDAILNCADDASAWFATANAKHPSSPDN
jgi:hypothetical protein